MYNNFIRYLNGISIRYKIFISYLIIIIITIAVFLTVNYFWISVDAEKQAIYSASQTLLQTKKFLEYKTNSVIYLANQICFNETIQEILNNDVNRHIDPLAETVNIQRIKSIIASLHADPEIRGINLYISSTFAHAAEGETFHNLNQAISSKWYKKVVANAPYPVWFPSSYFTNSDTGRIISAVRLVVNPEDYNKYIGIARIDISENDVRAVIDKSRLTKKSSILLINSENDIICTITDHSFTNDGNLDSILTILTKKDDNGLSWHTTYVANRKYLIGIERIDRTDWSMVLTIPYKDLLLLYTRSMNSILVAAILVIPIAFALSFVFSASNTKRIRELILNMRQAVKGNGDFNVDIIPSSNDEIGELVKNYNYMLTRISKLMEDEYMLGRQIKHLELKALQAQINPHFLYNTLDLANWMSINANLPQIGTLVQALSKFYKLSLSKGEEIVTLHNEMEHIKTYIQIQNMRFSDNIKLEIELPEKYLGCLVPKITLQPIVENSILHGILEKEDESGTIRIYIEEDGSDILIIIEDDGVGMTTEMISNLLIDFNENDLHGYSIKNINDRLALHFGEKYGLTYESKYGKGTTVRVRIPQSFSYK